MPFQISDLFVDVDLLPYDGYGFIQLIFLAAAYAFVLMQGANLIKDGSELLLLIPSWAGLVGSVVLPVLGAVPDGAIVLFSGLGPDAQQQLAVGIGALAGSTIMLLTVPWFLSVYAGRVNMDSDGNGNYVRPRGAGKEWSKLAPANRFAGTGVNVGSSIAYAAKIMGITLIPFLVIQIPSCIKNCSLKDQNDGKCDTPLIAALIGGILTILLFVFYLWDQKRLSDQNLVTEAKQEQARHKVLAAGLMSLQGIFQMGLGDDEGYGTLAQQSSFVAADPQFRAFLKPYFRRFDKDNSGGIDRGELKHVLEALGEHPAPDRIESLMEEMDKDKSGSIDFEEFCKCMERILAQGDNISGNFEAPHNASESAARSDTTTEVNTIAEGDEGGDEEEEDEMPEEWVDLSPEEQRKRILIRSFTLMTVGTIIVVLFSDPMVDVLSSLGDRTHIPAFYVAFVLAPLVSNGSELIAAYAYAGKKTEKTMTIALATLVGSACMNNTFCLGIFLFIVYGKQLKWEFTAEVTSIILVEIIMFALIHLCRRTMRFWTAGVVIALFPLSIALVAILEAAGLN